jgi:hypothetical protein
VIEVAVEPGSASEAVRTIALEPGANIEECVWAQRSQAGFLPTLPARPPNTDPR